MSLKVEIIAILTSVEFPFVQCIITQVEESLPLLTVPPSPGYIMLCPKEDEAVCSATTKETESFYSPLGEPDLRDLPSFAYQISQGMVCKPSCLLQMFFGQLPHCISTQSALYNHVIPLYHVPLTICPLRNTSPPWVSSTVTWPAATSWWMRGSCSRYQTLVSPEIHPSMCPPSRTRCH